MALTSPSVRRFTHATFWLCVMLVLGTLVGCGSARSTQTTETASDSPPAPQETVYMLLVLTHEGHLVAHDTKTESATHLMREVQSVGTHALSPDRSMLAVSYMSNDSTHAALVDQTGSMFETVHSVPGEATYSFAWHSAGDRLAMAYYRPSSDGARGPGDVLIVRPGDTPQRVGCRAAREVLHWVRDGTLATRDDDNIYLVASEGCATRASFDARRIHHATYSATGGQLAYIYRELDYDRDAGAYRPDSTLMLSAPEGQSSEVLFGDERAARHLRWAPEADELAFSARLDDAPRRQIMIYNAAQDRILFLVPPAQTPPGDQTHPRWSPSGTSIAYTQRTNGSSTAVVRVDGQTRQLGPTQGPIAGWIDERTVVIHDASRLRVVSVNGTERYAGPAPKAFLHGWITPSRSAESAASVR